jgi:lipopolysaccharide export system permease protein
MILTWYIFRQTLSNVLISSFVFVGIIWLSQSFKTIKLIINKGAGLLEFFILSAYSLPSWLLIALPFGTFAGCMISYLKLQNDKEIVVMKSAGINSFNLSKPAFFIAILVSIILLIISHFIMPKSYKNFKVLQNNIRNSSESFIIRDNVFIDLNKSQTIFINNLYENNQLEEIFIQDRSDPEFVVEFFAKKGNLNFGNNVILSMQNGTRISTDPKGKSTILNFKSYDIEIKRESDKKTSSRVIEYNEYNFFELLKKAQNAKEKKGKLLAEAHSRNTIAFMPLVFCLIVMVVILKDNYSRFFSIYRKTIGIGFLVLIQSLVLIIKNTVHSNINFLPLMYIFPIIILIACVFFINDNKKYDILSRFANKANK